MNTSKTIFVVLLAIMLLSVMPVVAVVEEETPTEIIPRESSIIDFYPITASISEIFLLPDLKVNNSYYYSADNDYPVVGGHFGIIFDITNIGFSTFNADVTVSCSSDRYFPNTLPVNENNIIKRVSSLYLAPGQTTRVVLVNYRPWGEFDKPGRDYLDFKVETNAPEENKENNEGTFRFVVRPK